MAIPRVLGGLGVAAGLALGVALDGSVAAAPASQQTVTVQMQGNPNRFDPAEITVAPGTTVTWVTVSGSPHTSTSDTGVWDSSNRAQLGDNYTRLAVGESFSFTFNQVGEYPYYCIPHRNSGMVGKVTVSATGGKGATSGMLLAAQ
jgi:plastocyanin